MTETRTTDSDLPTSPLAVRIVQAACRPDVELQELSELGQSDPAFTMRVLSLVNNAACGLGREVSSLAHAISMLGINGLRNVALSLSVSEMALSGPEGDLVLTHCIRRAVAARALAEASGTCSPDDSFTVGLLIDSGCLLHAQRDAAVAASLARSPAAVRPVLERLEGLSAHPGLGSEIAARWQMGAEVVAAIARHHDNEPPEAGVARVAWVAERFAAVYEGGDLSATRVEALRAAQSIGLSDEVAEATLASLPARVSEAGAVFDRDLGPQPEIDELLREANLRLVELNQNYQQLVTQLETLLEERQALTEKLREANSKLEQLATTDELTGLPNKRAFQAALVRDLSRAFRAAEPLSLVIFDIDHFKRVNDTHGHPAGDAVLRTIGRVVRAAVRQGDLPARYGGEEFVIVLPNTPLAGAEVVAERVRQRIEAEETPLEGGEVLRCTSSFGVACVLTEQGRPDRQALLEAADQALYAAKRAGRNRVMVAPPLGSAAA